MKIVSSGKGLHSPEFLRKKKKLKRVKRIFYSSISLIIFVLLVLLAHNNRIRINDIWVNGYSSSQKDVVATVEEYIGGKYFWLIPRSNAFVYPREEIRTGLLEKFPKFKSVATALSGFNTLEIQIEERQALALYCVEVVSPTNTSKCYYMDENGFIFAPAPSSSDNTYIVYTKDDELEKPVAQILIPEDEFTKLKTFLGQLRTLGIEALVVEVGKDTYSITMRGGTKLMWRKSGDERLIYTNLEAFLTSDEIGKMEKVLEKFQYLDLRTENKVFYRFRGE